MSSRNKPSGRDNNRYRINPTPGHGEDDLYDQEQGYHRNEGLRYGERQEITPRAPASSQQVYRNTVPVQSYATEYETPPQPHYYQNPPRYNHDPSFIPRTSDPNQRANYQPPLPQDTHYQNQTLQNYESDVGYQMHGQRREDASYNGNYQTSVQDNSHGTTNDSQWRLYQGNPGAAEYTNASSLGSGTFQETGDNGWHSSNPPWERERREAPRDLYNNLPSRSESHFHQSTDYRNQPLRYHTTDHGRLSDDASRRLPSPRATSPSFRKREGSGNLRRYGSSTDDQHPYTNVDHSTSGSNERRQPVSNWRTQALDEKLEIPAVTIKDTHGHWYRVKILVDNGNFLDDLVSKGTVTRLGLGHKVNQAVTKRGRTLGATIETLGTIDLDYHVITNGKTERYYGTFHVFDDSIVDDYDVLFAHGRKDGDLVQMVAFEKNSETEEERWQRRENERRLNDDRRRAEELLQQQKRKREEREEMEERKRRFESSRRRN